MKNGPEESVPTGNPVKSSSKDASALYRSAGASQPRPLEFNSALGESNEVRRVRQEEAKRPKQARQNEERDYRDAAIQQEDLDERRIRALAAARKSEKSPSATEEAIKHFREVVNGK